MMAMATDVIGIERSDNCKDCKMFNESAEFSYGPTAPQTVIEALSLTLYPAYGNDNKILWLWDSRSTLMDIMKEYGHSKDYTSQHIICRNFEGNQER